MASVVAACIAEGLWICGRNSQQKRGMQLSCTPSGTGEGRGAGETVAESGGPLARRLKTGHKQDPSQSDLAVGPRSSQLAGGKMAGCSPPPGLLVPPPSFCRLRLRSERFHPGGCGRRPPFTARLLPPAPSLPPTGPGSRGGSPTDQADDAVRCVSQRCFLALVVRRTRGVPSAGTMRPTAERTR